MTDDNAWLRRVASQIGADADERRELLEAISEPDEAEPEPDTIGRASGTAKCHHCGRRIYVTGAGWAHADTDAAPCDPAQAPA